jgi:hypothetical protein
MINMNTDFREIASNIRQRKYKRIGIGSGRVVYDLGNGFVVKVARNKKGIAQNEAEYKISTVAETDLLAKILDISEKSQYLIMEKAEKVNHISHVWKYFNVRSNRGLFQVKELRDICIKCDLLPWDFGRRVNWGKINDKPVVIDYGFTKYVKKKYY